MMRKILLSKKIYLILIVLVSLLTGINNVKTQTPRLIFKPSTTFTALYLNNDHHKFRTTAGFAITAGCILFTSTINQRND